MNDPAMGAGIWLDTVLRRLRHAAGYCAARLRGAAAMSGRDHFSPIGYGTPMPDIVERLRFNAARKSKFDADGASFTEAADEIERLRAALQEITQIEKGYEAVEIARRALEPKP